VALSQAGGIEEGGERERLVRAGADEERLVGGMLGGVVVAILILILVLGAQGGRAF
jgi:hypothetical protein